MSASRWALPFVAGLALAGLPACISVSKTDPPPPVEPAGSSEFARLRSPGERVALREADPPGPAEPPRVLKTANEMPMIPVGTLNLEPLPPAKPQAAEAPLTAAVRAHLEGRPELALDHMKGFDPPTQEFLMRLLPAVVRASQLNLEKAGPHELAILLAQLESAAAGLSGKVPLMVDKACFCREVRTFGRYDPLPEGQAFKPGARAELYAEVRNVPCEPVTLPVDGDGFLTKLVCTLQVHDAAGTVIDLPDTNRKLVPIIREAKRDFTRSPVRDYYVRFGYPVPTKAGSYTVTFEVHDPATGRAVSRTMPFRVQ